MKEKKGEEGERRKGVEKGEEGEKKKILACTPHLPNRTPRLGHLGSGS